MSDSDREVRPGHRPWKIGHREAHDRMTSTSINISEQYSVYRKLIRCIDLSLNWPALALPLPGQTGFLLQTDDNPSPSQASRLGEIQEVPTTCVYLFVYQKL